MAFPLVAVAMLAGSIIDGLWNIYQTDVSTKAHDKSYNFTANYHQGYYNENTRFWNDYIRLHHLENRKIVYPYRAGFNYDLSKMYTANANLDTNSVARSGSYIRALTGGARAGSFLYNVK